MDDLRALEEQLFNDYAGAGLVRFGAEPRPGPIFIVCAPRTGSTILYLLMIKRFGLSYLANLVNDHFAEYSAVGVMVHLARDLRHHLEVTLESRYGHTVGPFQPSEGTKIFNNWFGGEQPAESLSARPSSEGAAHNMAKTFAFFARTLPARLIVKNVWNSFRIPYLADAFPSAKFIWIRRQLADAALSDLHARYVIQGSPLGWNAATPGNVDDLKTLPYTEQVVENQIAYTRAISAARKALPVGQFIEIWYHDFVENPGAIVSELGSWLGLEPDPATSSRIYEGIGARPTPDLPVGDVAAVQKYVAASHPVDRD